MLKNRVVVFAIMTLFIFCTCVVGNTEAKLLSDEDFVVSYKNVSICPGDNTSFLEAMGTGTACENNNYGFIGWDPENKYKFYNHGYPMDNPILKIITRLDVVKGTSIIYQIDVSRYGTNRGLKKGDSFKKLIELYGLPKNEENNGSATDFTYKYNDKKMYVSIDEKKNVVNISLVIENK